MNEEDNKLLRIAGVVRESTVDGPGFRYVVFTQGCPHNCKGCHNPQTHEFNSGKLVNIDKIVEDIKKNPLLKGVTISGGEPFIQANSLAKLLSKLQKDKYTVITYTGYTYEYLINNANKANGFMELLEMTDVLIDGKFIEELKDQNILYRGSTNQRAIDIKNSLKNGKIIEYVF